MEGTTFHKSAGFLRCKQPIILLHLLEEINNTSVVLSLIQQVLVTAPTFPQS